MRINELDIIDFLGDYQKVSIFPVYSTKQFTDGQLAIRFIASDDDDNAIISWLAVFTEWFCDEKSNDRCDVRSTGVLRRNECGKLEIIQLG